MAARDVEHAVGGLKPAPRRRWKKRDVESGLQRLRPEVPWTHFFDLGGCPTICANRDEKWYRKAEGLRRFGEIAIELCRTVITGQSIEGKSVLDLACGEGGHSIMFAKAGAGPVVGIDGRQLAIERARFAADVLEVPNTEFRTGDVRTLNPQETGTSDIVLCSGILHHLEREQWFAFLKKVARLTADTAIFYTHIANEQLAVKHKLQKPADEEPPPPSSRFRKAVRAIQQRFARREEYFDGYLYREHRSDSSPEQRERKMRASLDNEHSFWATEEAIVQALRKAGFAMVFKVQWPHMFREQWGRDTRQIIIARKAG